jgi:putative tricarboxylic transport membrane protein
MRLSNTLIGIIFFILGGALLYNASLLAPVRHIEFGPGLLPSLVAAGMMLCGALLVARDVLNTKRLVFAVEFTEWRHSAAGVWTVASVLAGMAFYPITVKVMGFMLATAPFLLLLLRAGQVRWRTAVSIAILGALFSHIVFVELLRVPLPWGVLTPYSSLLSLR